MGMKTCPRCDKEIMRHWKYCNQCGRGCVLLDMDIEYMEKGASLSVQRSLQLQQVVDILVHENTELKEQYDILQENFHKLCAFKGAEFLEKLIYKI